MTKQEIIESKKSWVKTYIGKYLDASNENVDDAFEIIILGWANGNGMTVLENWQKEKIYNLMQEGYRAND